MGFFQKLREKEAEQQGKVLFEQSMERVQQEVDERMKIWEPYYEMINGSEKSKKQNTSNNSSYSSENNNLNELDYSKVKEKQNILEIDYSLGNKNINIFLKKTYFYQVSTFSDNNIMKLLFNFSQNYYFKNKSVDKAKYIDLYVKAIIYAFSFEIDFNKDILDEEFDRTIIRGKKYVSESGKKYNLSYIGQQLYNDVKKLIDDTITQLYTGYAVMSFLSPNSPFLNIYNKLSNEKVDSSIIKEKLQDIFEEDLKKYFDANDYEKQINLIAFIIIIKQSLDDYQEQLNNHKFDELQINYPIISLESIINDVPFNKYISYYNKDEINTKIWELSLNIVYYILNNTTVEFNLLVDFFKNFYTTNIELSNKVKKEYKENEINRILYGNVDAEKKKTKELYDFRSITDGFEFEEYVGRLYKKLGYVVEHTKLSGDQGADLVVEKGGIKTVVQTKLYTKPVGNTAVQEVVASIRFYKANNGIVVTNNTFTPSAIELAKKNNIELVDGNALNKIIDKVSK